MSRSGGPTTLAASALLAGLALLLAGCGGGTAAPRATASAEPDPAAQPLVVGRTLAARPCPSTAEPFEPTRVDVPGVDRGASVVYPARARVDVPGTPPVDGVGKQQFAYDRAQGVRPGDRRGNVLLNAHTWPDGSALGNRLLAGLREESRLVLSDGEHRLCYRVTERVEVPADQAFDRYYEQDGPARVAVVVCSGERLGPGVWTRRTVWFARPSA